MNPATEMARSEMAKSDWILADPWPELRRFTQARIALGRTGESLPTQAVLDFGLAHARARDAIHAALPRESIQAALREVGCESLAVRSAVSDRQEYLCRPDLGRRLSEGDRIRLSGLTGPKPDVALVIADGLSAQSAARHAVPLLVTLLPKLTGWNMGSVIIAEQARVALGDEIGELLGAKQVAILIGERPGLSSPDSLGIYITYHPRIGRTDAERNCISNVRPEGLSYDAAADKLYRLMIAARQLGLSGIALKDESDTELPRALQIKDVRAVSS